MVVDIVQVTVGVFHLLPVIGNATAIIVNTMISILATVLFFVWLKILGVRFFERFFAKFAMRKILVYIAIPALEFIPILKIFIPGWTIMVMMSVVIHNASIKYLSETERAQLNQTVQATKTTG